MKTLIYLLPILLIFSCKKEDVTHIKPTPPVVTPCASGYYGVNCDKTVLDKFIGEWTIYDSCILVSGPPSYRTTRKIIGTHTGYIVRFVDPNGIRFELTNFWGNDTSSTLVIGSDTNNIYTALMPDYNGVVVRSRDYGDPVNEFKRQQDGSYLFKKKVAINLGSQTDNNYFYIKLTKK